uniref:Uncharacterized protein n=1 Tax=Phlebotomus papatasi TaxID=29031 RepID=A0A1B0GQA1_PHLPP
MDLAMPGEKIGDCRSCSGTCRRTRDWSKGSVAAVEIPLEMILVTMLHTDAADPDAKPSPSPTSSLPSPSAIADAESVPAPSASSPAQSEPTSL